MRTEEPLLSSNQGDLRHFAPASGAPVIVHLTASPSYGGTERQMLELGRELAGSVSSVYLTFREEERCWDFVDQARSQGFAAHGLEYDTPRLREAFREILGLIRRFGASALVAHGYKPNLLGRMAARRLGIPAIAVSHGWTGESFRVRVYDWIDRLHLRWMDEVVCVSAAQAHKVRRCGVPLDKVRVIRDAVRASRFARPNPVDRSRLESFFPTGPEVIVGSAGRLSREKGFEFLVDAAAAVLSSHPNTGFVLFGDGPLREPIAQRIRDKNLEGRFVLPGFCHELDAFLPHVDAFVLPSFTEGLPNVVLEAFAAGVPVIATAVGGTPEVVEDGTNGYLVPPGDAATLADRIARLLAEPHERIAMGLRGRTKVEQEFSFAGQAQAYGKLFKRLLPQAGASRQPIATRSGTTDTNGTRRE